MKNQQRLTLLNQEEIHILYSLPEFTDVERQHYFSLPEPILKQLKLKKHNNNKTSTKLYFILQFGHFKAKSLFFKFQYKDLKADIAFIMKNYMPNDKSPKILPTNKQRAKIKRNILAYFGFQNKVKNANILILKKTSTLVKSTIDPHAICIDVINYLREQKAVLPSYSGLQDIIGEGLKKEELRLAKITRQNLTQKITKAINDLLKIDDVFYKITELKFDPKSFKKQEMLIEMCKLETCISIFNFSKTFLPTTNISRKNIEYYADLAKLYTIDRLRKLSLGLSSFYLICYVNQRSERIIDNLVKGFIYYVDKYSADAKKYVEENLLAFQSELEKHTESLGQLIELYADDETMKLPGKKIRAKAFKIMSKENILKLSKCLLSSTTTRNDLKTKLTWEYYKENYRLILNNLRPLFLTIDFASEPELNNLLEAIIFLKSHLATSKDLHDLVIDNCPTQHISSKKLLEYFVEPKTHGKKKKKFNIYQYEFYIYKLIRENLRKNRIFVNDSIEHKSFAVDIKKDPNWEKSQTKILKKLNNKVLLTPIDNILLELEELLESAIVKTNTNIANNENKDIKIRKCKHGEIQWTLPYPKQNDELDNPFYDNLEPINISDVYDFVAQQCSFIKAFKHFKPKYSKSKPDYLAIKGTTLANGTTQGTYQFSKRSNIKYNRLRIAEQNYIRLETIRGAGVIIADKLEQLPIFNLHDLSGKRHGSIDGTKKKTRRRTIKTRHSPKYFGLDVGIVIMTMTLNHVPFISEIIGANEHESHFSYPMLFNNITAIDPDIISTDTAGTNNINDFLFFILGKTHAACYRSIVGSQGI